MAVEVDGIVAMDKPVADVDVECLVAVGGCYGAREWCVAVAEDAVVEGLLIEPLLAVEDNAFAVVALIFKYGGIFLYVSFATVAAPPQG